MHWSNRYPELLESLGIPACHLASRALRQDTCLLHGIASRRAVRYVLTESGESLMNAYTIATTQGDEALLTAPRVGGDRARGRLAS